MKKKLETMKIVNPHAAGIDIGSRSYYVAIGQGKDQVKEFNVYSSGQNALINCLKEHNIRTIAMESTGSYWQTLFRLLQDSGFEVLLVSGRHTQNVRGKTDVKDCQWIQKLHSLGLLPGCYLPGNLTLRLRTLSRHRKSLIESASSYVNKMQKSLRLMNLRLDIVINDIVGVSGRRIIEAILSGERDGNALSKLADGRVRKSQREIADALQGQYNNELLFELKDNYELWQLLQERIVKCDVEIENLLNDFQAKQKHSSASANQQVILSKKQLKGKNQPKFNLTESCYNLFGVDLFAIEGVSSNTVLTFISEVGNDIDKFKTSKQFTSWLRLAPNNKITGNKVVSSRTPKGKNRLAIAFRDAANTVERLKKGTLHAFFKRIAYKKGRGAAVTATARKIATIFWNMLVKKQSYNPIQDEIYKEQIKSKKIATIKRLLKEYEIEILQLSAT